MKMEYKFVWCVSLLGKLMNGSVSVFVCFYLKKKNIQQEGIVLIGFPIVHGFRTRVCPLCI